MQLFHAFSKLNSNKIGLVCIAIIVAVVAGCGGGGGTNSGPASSSSSSSGSSSNNSLGVLSPIAGVLEEQQVLTAGSVSDVNGTATASYIYQWKRGTQNIANATDKTYLLTLEDVGASISVMVSYIDDEGHTEMLSATTESIIGLSLAPTASIIFPPPTSLTNADAITVRGTATDTGGGINGVRVNGVSALSDDGFSTWTASVPLSVGDNTLDVATEGTSGHSRSSASTAKIVREAVVWSHVSAMDIDEVNNLLYAYDHTSGKLVEVDLSNDSRRVLLRNESEGDLYLGYVMDLAVDPANNRIILLCRDSVYAITIDTGAVTELTPFENKVPFGDFPGSYYLMALGFDGKSIVLLDDLHIALLDTAGRVHIIYIDTGEYLLVSGDGAGSGPELVREQRMVANSSGSLLYVTDRSANAVVSVNSVTGERKIISGSSQGSGPDFDKPYDIQIDSDNNRLLVSSSESDDIIAVDIVTGNREIFASGGGGEALLKFDAMHNRLVVSDQGSDAFIAVDMTSGNRTTLSENRVGVGPQLLSPEEVAVDAQNNRAFVAGQGDDTITVVDLATGDRTVWVELSDELEIEATAFDLDSNQALVWGSEKIVSVDLVSKEVTTVASDSIGSGPALFEEPSAITVNVAGNYAVLAGAVSSSADQDELMRVALLTGDRTAMTNGGVLTSIRSASDLEIDSVNQKLFVLDTLEDAIFEFDLSESGEIESENVVSGDYQEVGAGDGFYLSESMVFNSDENIGYVGDSILDVVFSVDFNSGDREIISDDSAGKGVYIELFSGVSLSPWKGVILSVGTNVDGLIAVDVVTGERVYISK